MNVVLLAVLLTGICGPLAAAQETLSAPLARKLTTLLDERKLESVAARMPDEHDQFVAALYVPHSQLLVIRARYRVPALLREQVLTGEHREAYDALNGSGERPGRFSVVDMDADGLHPARSDNGRFDIIYEQVIHQTMLDGSWKKQKLSERAYLQKFATADRHYAAMLSALIAELSVRPQ